jgi:hypothetical protein
VKGICAGWEAAPAAKGWVHRPWERSGAITCRPLHDDDTAVLMVIQRSRSGSAPRAARDLHEFFERRAEDYRLRKASSR